MGLFDFFKAKPKSEPAKSAPGRVLVDGVYSVTLPSGWRPYASDRFRAKTDFGDLHFSITNYAKPLNQVDVNAASAELHRDALHLFAKFITEGEYEPFDDRDLQAAYAYQGFQVDEETQYYFYTYRSFGQKFYRINFILRETKPYDPSRKELLMGIAASIQF